MRYVTIWPLQKRDVGLVANSDIAIYEGPGGRAEVRVDRKTVWRMQRQMAGLFDSSADHVSLHFKNIYADRESDASFITLNLNGY